MSLILGIDTSAYATHVALLRDEEVLAQESSEHSRSAESISALLRGVLQKSGVSIKKVSEVAVTLGPGSFTGLRTGIAAAQGLGVSLGVEVVGVSSFIGRTLGSAAPNAVLSAAHRSAPEECFVCELRFDGQGELCAVSEIDVRLESELSEDVLRIDSPGSLYEGTGVNPAVHTCVASQSIKSFDSVQFQRRDRGIGLEALYVKPVHAKTIAERRAARP